jgi:hypothetical protein
MNRKLTYSLTLFVLIVMWGMFGFVTALPKGAQPDAQDTIGAPTPAPSPLASMVVPATELVPVTGNDASTNVMRLLFYGFLGMLVVVLLLALLASARRTVYVHDDGPPPPPDDL